MAMSRMCQPRSTTAPASHPAVAGDPGGNSKKVGYRNGGGCYVEKKNGQRAEASGRVKAKSTMSAAWCTMSVKARLQVTTTPCFAAATHAVR